MKNLLTLIRAMGIVLFVKYKLGIAKEGKDFWTEY